MSKVPDLSGVGKRRTEARIRSRFQGFPYVATWLGSLPVYLSINRTYLKRHNWLLAPPRPLHSPPPLTRKATDRLVRVKPKFIMPGEEEDNARA